MECEMLNFTLKQLKYLEATGRLGSIANSGVLKYQKILSKGSHFDRSCLNKFLIQIWQRLLLNSSLKCRKPFVNGY